MGCRLRKSFLIEHISGMERSYIWFGDYGEEGWDLSWELKNEEEATKKDTSLKGVSYITIYSRCYC